MSRFPINTHNSFIGKKFEDIVLYEWIYKKYPSYLIDRDVYFKELGIELDFVAKDNDGSISWVAEAKGGEGSKWNKGGGARRTDNAKKAILNLAYIKQMFPQVKTFCFFTFEPRKGKSSDLMIENAKRWKWIDEVIYIEPKKQKTILEEFYG